MQENDPHFNLKQPIELNEEENRMESNFFSQKSHSHQVAGRWSKNVIGRWLINNYNSAVIGVVGGLG